MLENATPVNAQVNMLEQIAYSTKMTPEDFEDMLNSNRKVSN